MFRTLAILVGGLLGFIAAGVIASDAPRTEYGYVPPVSPAAAYPPRVSPDQVMPDLGGERSADREPYPSLTIPPSRAQAVDEPGQNANEMELLQHALKRSGCYQGPVDGLWTIAFHRALEAFLANAEMKPAQFPSSDALIEAVLVDEDGFCRTPGSTGHNLASPSASTHVPSPTLARRHDRRLRADRRLDSAQVFLDRIEPDDRQARTTSRDAGSFDPFDIGSGSVRSDEFAALTPVIPDRTHDLAGLPPVTPSRTPERAAAPEPAAPSRSSQTDIASLEEPETPFAPRATALPSDDTATTSAPRQTLQTGEARIEFAPRVEETAIAALPAAPADPIDPGAETQAEGAQPPVPHPVRTEAFLAARSAFIDAQPTRRVRPRSARRTRARRRRRRIAAEPEPPVESLATSVARRSEIFDSR